MLKQLHAVLYSHFLTCIFCALLSQITQMVRPAMHDYLTRLARVKALVCRRPAPAHDAVRLFCIYYIIHVGGLY